MGIQIFGTSKNFDTKKAQRFFSERRISFQFVDLKEKGMSPAEMSSVISCIAKREGSRKQAVESITDKSAKDYASIAYLDDSEKEEKLLENPLLMKLPIVRNSKTDATSGYKPEIWETWK
ncbi:MAG: ArsC family transcriptional regulator [Treponema sp.]|nr:ArsC family transcriptional regulator [Treponema sp.]